MFAQIATFLIDTIVSFLVFLLLARFHFQWLRVPFRNPMGEFLLATTSWLVLPARRVIPGLAGLDLATLLLAWVLQALGLWAQASIMGSEPGALALAAVAGVDLVRYSLYILVFAVFVQVAISWVNPDAPLYDSTVAWRERAMRGILHSGTLVRDRRSDERTCL